MSISKTAARRLAQSEISRAYQDTYKRVSISIYNSSTQEWIKVGVVNNKAARAFEAKYIAHRTYELLNTL